MTLWVALQIPPQFVRPSIGRAVRGCCKVKLSCLSATSIERDEALPTELGINSGCLGI